MPLNLLTLVCPTYKRESYLKRSVEFWARQPFEIIYMDGSPEASDIDFSGFANVGYFHDPRFIMERLETAAGLISTPYACMVGDDEYFVPSALQDCIDFLQVHPSHASCMGRALGFDRKSDQLVFNTAYPRLQGLKLTDDSPMQRLAMHWSQYVPAHCYSVTRTPVWKRAVNLSFISQFNAYAIAEIQWETVICAAGKSEVLPILYWLRSDEAPPTCNTGDVSLDPSKSFAAWWRNPATSSQKKNFLESLAGACSSDVDIKGLENVLDRYVANNYPKKGTSSWLRSIKTRIVGKFKRKLLSLIPSLAEDSLKLLRKQGAHIDDDDLLKCCSSIKASWQS